MAARSMSIGYVWFSFQGRINRSAFWLLYFLPVLGVSIFANVLDFVLGTMHQTAAGPIGIIGTAVGILLLWPALAAGAKRLHDRDRSGWWQLLYLVPFFGALFLFIYLGFLKGTEGPNSHGPDPLGDRDWPAGEMAHG